MKCWHKILLIIIFCNSNEIFCQELPISTENFSANNKFLILYFSGDGGWNSFDKKMVGEFKSAEMSYIGLNSFKYFWKAKTPEIVVKDIEPILQNYLKSWKKENIILIGYSFGAEIMPFLFTRLPNDLKQKIKLLILITPAKTSDFTIHVNDMIMLDGNYAFDVSKEIEKIKLTKVLCIFGERETSIFPKSYKQENLKIEYQKGGHSFSDSKSVMNFISKELK